MNFRTFPDWQRLGDALQGAVLLPDNVDPTHSPGHVGQVEVAQG